MNSEPRIVNREPLTVWAVFGLARLRQCRVSRRRKASPESEAFFFA
jgi:hypothetical protein